MAIANTGDALRKAVALVRGNPAAKTIEAELDAAEKAQAEAAAAEAKRRASAQSKVDADLPALTAELMADYEALRVEAVRAAAEDLARQQLEIKHGLVNPKVLAFSGAPPVRLGIAFVDRKFDRLATSTPIGWDKAGRLPAVVRSEQAKALHDALAAGQVDDVEARIAERMAKLEADRQRRIADRKAAAGIGPKAA